MHVNIFKSWGHVTEKSRTLFSFHFQLTCFFLTHASGICLFSSIPTPPNRFKMDNVETAELLSAKKVEVTALLYDF